MHTSTNDKLNEMNASTNSKLDEMNTSTNSKLDEMNASTNSKLDEMHTSTNSKLDEMHTSTNSKLDEMNASTNNKLDEMNSSTNDKLNEMNTSTNSRLDELGNRTDSKLKEMDEQTRKLIGDLDNSTGSRLDKLGKNTNSKLDEMNKSTSGRIDSLDKSTSSKIDAMGRSTSNRLDALDKSTSTKLDGMNKTNTNKFNELNNSINNNFKSMTNTSTSNMNGLKNYIAVELNKTNGKLDKVFQRVSDGKKLLASTLLTKGVKVRQDATFKELSDAINRIPQQVVLGNGDVAGKVEYEYHYHKDGTGNVCDEDYVPANRKGGCYTIAETHKHSESCYKTEYWYSYRTRKDCQNLYHVGDPDNGDDPIFRWHCDYCGSEYDSDDGYHYETTRDPNVFRERARSNPEIHMDKVKICKYEEGQLLGYRTSCEYVHGQILKAHISFDQNHKDYNSTVNVPSPRNLNLETSHVMVPENSLNIESLLKELELSPDEEEASSLMSSDESAASTSMSKESDISDIPDSNHENKQYESQKENNDVASKSSSIIEPDTDSPAESVSADGSIEENSTSQYSDEGSYAASLNETMETESDMQGDVSDDVSEGDEAEITDASTEGSTPLS